MHADDETQSPPTKARTVCCSFFDSITISGGHLNFFCGVRLDAVDTTHLLALANVVGECVSMLKMWNTTSD
jgi:hypothetical protein